MLPRVTAGKEKELSMRLFRIQFHAVTELSRHAA
jgi:hypothetical protein